MSHRLPIRVLVCLALLVAVAPVMRAADKPAPPDFATTIKGAVPKATDQVLASAKSTDPIFRANAIEAAQNLPDRVGPLVGLGLEDASPAVRFAALATIGKLKLTAMAPGAREQLKDSDPSVRAAALFALRRCGQTVDITPLATMMGGKDPRVRANAALLLGWLGDKSAIPMLKERAAVPMPRVPEVQEALLRLQITEAIVRLGDESVLSALRAAAYSQFDEVRVLAVSMMGDLDDFKWEPQVREILNHPPIELQLAAAGTLAHFGNPAGLDTTLSACGSELAPVRAQAAMTLAHFRDPRAAEALVKLLDDASEQVRLSAAAAVLRPAQ